jgi:hypothetical protein
MPYTGPPTGNEATKSKSFAIKLKGVMNIDPLRILKINKIVI